MISRFAKRVDRGQNRPLAQDEQDCGYGQGTIPASIAQCQELVKGIFNESTDIVLQPFETICEKAMAVYVDGLTNKDLIDRDLIAPMKSPSFRGDLPLSLRSQIKEVEDVSTVIKEVLDGNTAIFYEGSKKAYIADFKQWDKRSVGPPDVESSIRGPKEGFTEAIRTNTSLLRRRIKTPKLIIESQQIGKQSNTALALVYVDGIVNQQVLQELKNRLAKIDTGAVLESGIIEQYIQESTFGPISGIGMTQRPDYAAARILDGRVAILCDGTPEVLTVPELFIDNLHTGEDYYNRVVLTSLLRLLRLFGLFVAVMLPGLATSVVTYSQEMMPPVFLTTLIASTQKTPLPMGAEVFFLIIMFELLKEAGTRLPKNVGSAITIVGALIIGDAAVNAGIVSAPAVIIVALTAVASFIVPNLNEFVLVYRFLFWLLGSTMGLIGISTGMVIMLTQLITTTSFGIPILSNFSKNELKDMIIQFPIWAVKYRPETVVKDNVKRRSGGKVT